MATAFERLRRIVPAAWVGALLAIAAIAAPSAFAVLERAHAGLVVNRIFEREAWLSLVAAVLLLAMGRRAREQAAPGDGQALNTDMLLVLGTVFCTVAGYFVIQPMLPAARLGTGPWTFGQLHAASVVFFGLKIGLLLALSWRAQA